ncbi:hypothetical protein [Corallococcus macrosporus]|uniref:hypothetical protein n=1 Tax=Corallococcus macrosporus TaxID=35 RepID=UPI0012FDC798|nr:hypothetical protein [Corallococcus macrosporus]
MLVVAERLAGCAQQRQQRLGEGKHEQQFVTPLGRSDAHLLQAHHDAFDVQVVLERLGKKSSNLRLVDSHRAPRHGCPRLCPSVTAFARNSLPTPAASVFPAAE